MNKEKLVRANYLHSRLTQIENVLSAIETGGVDRITVYVERMEPIGGGHGQKRREFVLENEFGLLLVEKIKEVNDLIKTEFENI